MSKPCLKENGSKTGYEVWKQPALQDRQLQDQIEQGCHKGCGCECRKVAGPIQKVQHPGPTRGKVNFLPNYPHGETKDTLQTLRPEMVEHLSLFLSLMICTITLTHTEHVFNIQDELEATQEGAVALLAVVIEEEVLARVPFETHHVVSRPLGSGCNVPHIFDRFTGDFV